MPLVGPDLIASWYTLTYNPVPDVTYPGVVPSGMFILQNWTEDTQQSVEIEPMISGDMGPHVAKIGGIKYITSIDTPVLVLNKNIDVQIGDIFALLADKFEAIRNPQRLMADIIGCVEQGNFRGYSILQEATITIDPEAGLKISMTLVSPDAYIFTPTLHYIDGEVFEPGLFVSRTAAFFDTIFNVRIKNLASTFIIKQGTINIKANISENFFVGGVIQTPYFGVKSYSITGDLDIWSRPDYPLSGQNTNPNDFPYFPYLDYQNTIVTGDGTSGNPITFTPTASKFTTGEVFLSLAVVNHLNFGSSVLLPSRFTPPDYNPSEETPSLVLGSAFMTASVKRSLNPAAATMMNSVHVSFKHFATAQPLTFG